MVEHIREPRVRVKERKVVPPTRYKKDERVAIPKGVPTFWISGMEGVRKDGGKAIPSLRMMDK